MPLRGIWGVSGHGLWEVAYPIVRKFLIVGLGIFAARAIMKLFRIPDHSGALVWLAFIFVLFAIWLWVESVLRRRFAKKSPKRSRHR